MRGAVLIAILGALLLMGRRTLGKILDRQVMRRDALGNGAFGARRRAHTHQGLDLVARRGEPVYSPVDGTFVRRGKPYANDDRFSLVVLNGEGLEVKLMYVAPKDGLRPGDPVKRGEVIGTAQAVSDKYGDDMTDHVHVELRRVVGAHLLNPAPLLELRHA